MPARDRARSAPGLSNIATASETGLARWTSSSAMSADPPGRGEAVTCVKSQPAFTSRARRTAVNTLS